MIAQRTKQLFLWIPTLTLVITTIIVVLLLVVDSRQRIANLEDGQSPSVITFTFNNSQGRFRIVCKEDPNSANTYVCTTIPINRPTPSPTRTGG